MKKIILILIIITSANYSFGQDLTKNEVDEFTGKTVKETSWQILNKKSALYSYVRFRKVDSTIYFVFKMMIGNTVYSVDKGEVLYLKFADEEIIKLSNTQYQLTTYGAGATGLAGSKMLGVELTCIISQEILSKMVEKTLAKVRVYTSDGYVEAEVKEKQAENFMELAKLID
jgi:hypothetical protein